jgi:hypothetical protein
VFSVPRIYESKPQHFCPNVILEIDVIVEMMLLKLSQTEMSAFESIVHVVSAKRVLTLFLVICHDVYCK